MPRLQLSHASEAHALRHAGSLTTLFRHPCGQTPAQQELTNRTGSQAQEESRAEKQRSQERYDSHGDEIQLASWE